MCVCVCVIINFYLLSLWFFFFLSFPLVRCSCLVSVDVSRFHQLWMFALIQFIDILFCFKFIIFPYERERERERENPSNAWVVITSQLPGNSGGDSVHFSFSDFQLRFFLIFFFDFHSGGKKEMENERRPLIGCGGLRPWLSQWRAGYVAPIAPDGPPLWHKASAVLVLSFI